MLEIRLLIVRLPTVAEICCEKVAGGSMGTSRRIVVMIFPRLDLERCMDMVMHGQ